MRISVCIPTYNQSQYIEKTIQSVLDQSFQPHEIIVSNDSSTDDTISLVESFVSQSDKIKLFNQEQNLGISRNNDFVLKKASCEIIVRLDSDDLLGRDYLDKLVSKLNKYSEAGYAHCAIRQIDELGNEGILRFLARNNEYQNGIDAFRDCINGYKVAANIIMFRKTALEKVGFIQSKINFAEDYYLSASLAKGGFGNVYIPEVLASYRVLSDKGMVRQKRKFDEIKGITAVFDKVIQPGFIEQGLNIDLLNRKKSQFARNQAESLGWAIYTQDEKKELLESLRCLSNGDWANLYYYLYLNNCGSIINVMKTISIQAKQLLKRIVYPTHEIS